jgi:hypothetical protein
LAEPNHLKKYTTLYSSLGLDTLNFVAPPTPLFIPSQIPGILARLRLPPEHASRQIVVHAMSNNGAYSLFLALLNGVIPKAATLGYAFDSAPCVPVARTVAHGAAVGWNYPALARPVELLTGLGLCFSRQHRQLKLDIVRGMRRMPCEYRGQKYLFLYSPSDELVPSVQIERFATRIKRLKTQDALRSMGEQASSWNYAEVHERMRLAEREVELVSFESSGHCAHFRRSPVEYRDVVKKFVARCEGETTASKRKACMFSPQ